MQISIADERLSLSEAARLMKCNTSTLWRWTLTGIKGVKLATFNVGGRRFTTKEALEEFVAATTAAATGQPAPTRTPRQAKRSKEAAERQLARSGI